jgi:hypothetical protein
MAKDSLNNRELSWEPADDWNQGMTANPSNDVARGFHLKPEGRNKDSASYSVLRRHALPPTDVFVPKGSPTDVVTADKSQHIACRLPCACTVVQFCIIANKRTRLALRCDTPCICSSL